MPCYNYKCSPTPALQSQHTPTRSAFTLIGDAGAKVSVGWNSSSHSSPSCPWKACSQWKRCFPPHLSCLALPCLPGAHGLREEPEFVTARAGESVILRCDVIHPVTGLPPPYVVEWFKFGVPIPIFIKFGFYPPHVDPEYAGESHNH